MAKMLHLLLDWEYPHWMMMAGAILVALGFIGLAFDRNRNVEPDRAAGNEGEREMIVRFAN
jgi:hypothetical protein